jgi:superfamily II DNA/RNA helicase
MKNKAFHIDLLQPFLKENWKNSSFNKFTAIQKEVIPKALDNENIIAQSPTGTGKTLAYIIPILQKVDSAGAHPQAIILASSQELVMQIFNEIRNWSKGSDIRITSIIGGANIKRQLEKLKQKPHIIVGTAGRVFELIQMKKIKMHHVRIIVLDEVDQLLEKENEQLVTNIIQKTPAERQILAFSATVIEDMEKKITKWITKPIVIKNEKDEDMPDVEHIYFLCEYREKIELLKMLVKMENMKAIGFIEDIGRLSVLEQKLKFKNVSLTTLHSELKKQEREKVIQHFLREDIPLLLATDVAARGLDLKGINHVIHFDIPRDAKQYIHRSGRTGRMGSHSGTVVSIVTYTEEKRFLKLIKSIGITIKRKKISKGQIIDVPNKKSKYDKNGH